MTIVRDYEKNKSKGRKKFPLDFKYVLHFVEKITFIFKRLKVSVKHIASNFYDFYINIIVLLSRKFL